MTLEVKIKVDMPDISAGTSQQLVEWLEFQLGKREACSADNPYLLMLGKLSAKDISWDAW